MFPWQNHLVNDTLHPALGEDRDLEGVRNGKAATMCVVQTFCTSCQDAVCVLAL